MKAVLLLYATAYLSGNALKARDYREIMGYVGKRSSSYEEYNMLNIDTPNKVVHKKM